MKSEFKRVGAVGGMLMMAAGGCAVASDFRRRDVAAGGEGAPLSALVDDVLFPELPRPAAVLNLGGMANLTFLGSDGDVTAFDTGSTDIMYLVRVLNEDIVFTVGLPFLQPRPSDILFIDYTVHVHDLIGTHIPLINDIFHVVNVSVPVLDLRVDKDRI